MDEKRLTFEEYQEQTNISYRSNNIIREKAEVYYDFLSSLLIIIDETYLGSDVVVTQEDMSNHFTWCLNRILLNFEQEKIHFMGVNPNYDYLWYFFYKGYYSMNDGNKRKILLSYFKLLFSFNNMKSISELESFFDFYKLLDQNLKKTN